MIPVLVEVSDGLGTPPGTADIDPVPAPQSGLVSANLQSAPFLVG